MQWRPLQLFALAYNLGNFLRRLALPRPVKHWSLTTLREKLIKIGAKVVRHASYVTFQLAEVPVPRKLFAAILERIQWFGVPPPLSSSAFSHAKRSSTADSANPKSFIPSLGSACSAVLFPIRRVPLVACPPVPLWTCSADPP
jgi:hypothetical protein